MTLPNLLLASIDEYLATGDADTLQCLKQMAKEEIENGGSRNTIVAAVNEIGSTKSDDYKDRVCVLIEAIN